MKSEKIADQAIANLRFDLPCKLTKQPRKSRMKPPKIACKAIFYLTNCVRTFGSRMPNNRGFCDFFAKKSHKNLQAQQALRLNPGEGAESIQGNSTYFQALRNYQN
jgi:hypothetical protein